MRALILGNSGSGKSTFARILGSFTDTEVIHLDKLYWQPGWRETPRELWECQIETLLKKPAWIMDGNFLSTLDKRAQLADVCIYLDFPRRVCYWRILKRLIKYRRRQRPDMAGDCPEKIDREFILWIWNFPKKMKPKILQTIKLKAPDLRLRFLRTNQEVSQFFKEFEALCLPRKVPESRFLIPR